MLEWQITNACYQTWVQTCDFARAHPELPDYQRFAALAQTQYVLAEALLQADPEWKARHGKTL